VTDSLETIRRECAASQAQADQARARDMRKTWRRSIALLIVSVVLFLTMAAVIVIDLLS